MNISHDIIAALIAASGVGFGIWKDRRNRMDTERFEKWKFEQTHAKEVDQAIKSYDLSILSMAVEKVPAMLAAQIQRMEGELTAAQAKCAELTRLLQEQERINRGLKRELDAPNG